MRGWTYILKCADDTYYTGSTNNILLRIAQHERGDGANHTARRLPVTLVYYEEYDMVQDAYFREKQIQGWSRRKKESLINNNLQALKIYSACYKEIQDAINNKNGRFKSVKPNLEEVKNVFNLDDTHISEVLSYLAHL